MDTITCIANYSCEFSWFNFIIDVLVSFFGAFFGFGFALWIYYCKNKKEKNDKIEEEKAEHKDRLFYMGVLIDGVLKKINDHINYVNEYVEAKTKEPAESFVLKMTANNDIARLLSMDSQNVFLSFRYFFKKEHEWIKEYRKLYSNLDYIEGHFNEVIRVIKSYNTDQLQIQKNIKELVDNLPSFMTKFAMEIRKANHDNYKEIPQFQFLDSFVGIYGSLAESKAKLIDYDSKLLVPLIETLMAKFQNEYFTETILYMAKTARVRINDLCFNTEHIIAEFSVVKGNLTAQIKALEDFKMRLDSIQ